MESYQTPQNSEPVAAIKSGKIETNLNFSPTKESKPQTSMPTPQREQPKNPSMGWHTHHEDQPKPNHNVAVAKKNKKKDKEDCSLF